MNYTNQDYKMLAEIILKTQEKFKKFRWDDENTLSLGETKAPIGKIIMNKKEMVVKGDEVMAFVKHIIKDIEKNKPLTQTEIGASIFKDYSGDSYGNIASNSTLFHNLQKQFTGVGISCVRMSQRFTLAQSVCSEPTLMIKCSIRDDNAQFEDNYSGAEIDRKINVIKGGLKITNTPDMCAYLPAPMIGEKEVVIDLFGTKIGSYFKDRNLVTLLINPFNLPGMSYISGCEGANFSKIIALLTPLGIKKAPVKKDMGKRIFINQYLSKNKDKIKELTGRLESYEQEINSYQDRIRRHLEDYKEDEETINFLKVMLEKGGEKLFEEIEQAKKLSFVKSLVLKDEKIIVTFIPTTLESIYEGNRTTAWLGEITFTITPSGFKVSNTCPMVDGENLTSKRNAHTHGSSGGSPCFGSGDSQRKIMSLFAENKFEALTKMLWFWVKTHREGGAYVRFNRFITDRFRQGYPVWDKNDNRLEIPSDVQRAPNYEGNIKKFKDMKKN